MKRGIVKKITESRIVESMKDRIGSIEPSDDMVKSMRVILLLTAILALYLTFEMGDDWFVREYANYDWARHIGY